MNRLFIAAALTAIGLPDFGSVLAESAPDTPQPSFKQPGPEFDLLVQRLGSPSFIHRDWAARQLLEYGPQTAVQLAESIRTASDDGIAAAAIELLAVMARDGDPSRAAAAQRALAAALDRADGISDGRRLLLLKARRDAGRFLLAQLAAIGAEINRDETGRILRISVHSDRMTDRLLPLVGAFPEVRVLDLRGSPVSGRGLTHLAPLVHLERLVLTDTQLTGEDLRHLPALPRLRDLSLYRIPLTADDLSWLRHHLPHCQVNR